MTATNATRAAGSSAPACSAPEYRADFLWPHDDGSVEEAGYEFANARTEDYRCEWWNILIERIVAQNAANDGRLKEWK